MVPEKFEKEKVFAHFWARKLGSLPFPVMIVR